MAPKTKAVSRPVKKARLSATVDDTPKTLRQTIVQGKKVVATPKTSSLKGTRHTTLDESGAALKSAAASTKADVVAPAEVLATVPSSSDGEESEDDEDDDVDMDDVSPDTPNKGTSTNGVNAHKEDGPVEPSFSDLLLSGRSDMIQVNDDDDVDNKAGPGNALATTTGNNAVDLSVLDNSSNLSAPHLTSLLTTALHTKDLALLRTCLSPRTTPTSLATIRLTIERLPSSLVVSLLGHIADVMHRRPGRAGSLMVWVQWSLVCHGGYIASLLSTTPSAAAARSLSSSASSLNQTPSQQEAIQLVRKLRALDQVCTERKRNLDRLLQLKGKLDILVAQSKLRRERIEGKRRQVDVDSRKRVWIEDEDGDGEVMIGPNGVVPTENVVDVESVLRIEGGLASAAAPTPRSTKKRIDARAAAAAGGFDDDSSSGDDDADGGVVPVSFMSSHKSKSRSKGKRAVAADAEGDDDDDDSEENDDDEVDEEEEEDDDDEDDDEDPTDDLGGLLDVEAESTDDEDDEEEEEDSDENGDDDEDMDGQDLAGLSTENDDSSDDE